MNTISNTVWQRKGSSVVFDSSSLAPLIRSGAVVSLREVLSWKGHVPQNPGIPGKTVLVAGLETILEVLPPQEAEDFLLKRIRPLLMELQNIWTESGVVLGFATHENAFEVKPMQEEILFRRKDRKTIRLSESLWDGTGSLNMKQIVREGDEQGKQIVVGYYVARIS